MLKVRKEWGFCLECKSMVGVFDATENWKRIKCEYYHNSNYNYNNCVFLLITDEISCIKNIRS